jgi:hypothetical protein
MLQAKIEDGVTDLVTDFVGVTHTDRFAGKQIVAAGHYTLLLEKHFGFFCDFVRFETTHCVRDELGATTAIERMLDNGQKRATIIVKACSVAQATAQKSRTFG